MKPRVVVIGGGLAGLQAALACATSGTDVTLLERSPRLGGETFSFTREGLSFDNGQHVFLRCCTAYRSFLRQLGVERLTTLQERLAIPVLADGGRVQWLRRTGLKPPFHLAGSVSRYQYLSNAERRRAARAMLRLKGLDPDDPVADLRTFGEWLAQENQSPSAIQALWDLIALPALNLPAAQASLGLALRVFKTGLLSDAGAADIGFAQVPLARLHAEPAAAALDEAGARVVLGTPAVAIEPTIEPTIEPGVGPGAALRVRTSGTTLEADAVILAVPHDAAASLLPPEALPGNPDIRRLGHSPIVNLHIAFDRPVMDYTFAAGVGTPVQWVFDRTASSGLPRGQMVAVSLSAADQWIDRPVEELRGEFLPALERLFPRVRSARVLHFVVTRERQATFRQSPGTRALRPAAATTIPGLSVAGAWTMTGWPATMEGAVRSGVAAAREALRHVGHFRAAPAAIPSSEEVPMEGAWA